VCGGGKGLSQKILKLWGVTKLARKISGKTGKNTGCKIAFALRIKSAVQARGIEKGEKKGNRWGPLYRSTRYGPAPGASTGMGAGVESREKKGKNGIAYIPAGWGGGGQRSTMGGYRPGLGEKEVAEEGEVLGKEGGSEVSEGKMSRNAHRKSRKNSKRGVLVG